MKPVIGVIPLFDEERDSIWMLPGYMEGIRMAGGLPIILPLKAVGDEIARIMEVCSGFLFTGGQDVNPALYGAEKKPACGKASHDRDTLEKEIFARALKADKPVFGICRGIQLINVLCGGTLYQDLPTEYKGTKAVDHHMKPPYDVPCHQVEILADTPLGELTDEMTVSVNSYHHQAVKELAQGLKPMAVSEDGLVEALYMPGKKFVQAVQWHPEFIYESDENARKLFQAFVKACGE
ncbi:MAG: gamma-glutamyl-gamma-aminobutyrate hydrolase family protein [Lachnospiraceae bacterium]|nr:gamma-glutamyl-gamma-aminobutyrate hydrolase family protein [Lachnospiraceae bacterium]